MGCDQLSSDKPNGVHSSNADSLQLAHMISGREKSMIEKDIHPAISQFTHDTTWINSQGYFFEGKKMIRPMPLHATHGRCIGTARLIQLIQ